MKNIKIIQQLHDLGITGYEEVVYNPSYEQLFKEESSAKNQGFEKGAVTESGAMAVKTGIFTGRSPKDRYIVMDDVTKDTISWDGKVNFPTTPEIFDHCKNLVLNQLSKSKKSSLLMLSAELTRIPVLKLDLSWRLPGRRIS